MEKVLFKLAFEVFLYEIFTRRVLVESWVSGVSIATFLEPGSDPKIQRQLANRGADMLLQMVCPTWLSISTLNKTRFSMTTSGTEIYTPETCL